MARNPNVPAPSEIQTSQSPLAVRRSMQANKAKDTKPELLVRRLIHGMGFRYRLHRKDLPGTPDVVFGPRRKALFIHGCFWHQHGCQRTSITPKANSEFWAEKLRRNVERDERALRALEEAGWKTYVVWECQTKRGKLDDTAIALRKFIEEA